MAEVSRAVLVTGCSSGIGRATAEHLASAGWRVYATARRPESLADLAERGCRTLALDVTDEESMRAAVGAVEEAEGAVGVLVNNAGYSQSGALETLSMERLRAQFETNVFGLVRMCQLVLEGMRRQGWGRIVNVASLLSFQGGITVPGYTAAKSGIAGLVRALSNEWAGRGVTVNAIAPGYIATDNTQALQDDENRSRAILERIPAGRWGRADDLGGAAVFLASDAARYVTGAILPVDGGWLGR